MVKNGNCNPNLISRISILNLEAPLIIILWQLSLSQVLRISVLISEYLISFLAVWLGYSADRFIDHLVFKKIPKQSLSIRHCFWRGKKPFFLLIWFAIFITANFLSYKFLSSSSLLFGYTLAFFAVVYLYLNSVQNRGSVQFRKEEFIALLLTTSVGFPFINIIPILVLIIYLLPVCFLFKINLAMVSEEQRKYDLALGIPEIKVKKNDFTLIVLLIIISSLMDSVEYKLLLIVSLLLLLVAKRNKCTYHFYDLAIGIPPFLSIFFKYLIEA